MTFSLLLELLDKEDKESRKFVNSITQVIFGMKAGPVIDKKRSKEPIFYGVAHERSRIQDANKRSLMLTFDNSTDSGEYELNSLTPLKITKGSDLDLAIHKLYKKHKVVSTKRIKYLQVGDDLVIREIHFGKEITERTVKMAKDLLKLFRGEQPDEEDDENEQPEEKEPEEKPEEPEEKEEKPKVSKTPPKEAPKVDPKQVKAPEKNE
jgi:hypothetical protein